MTDHHCRENDITGVIEPTFSTEDESFGEIQTIDLKPNGRNIEVTNDNKKEYIECVPHDIQFRYEVVRDLLTASQTYHGMENSETSRRAIQRFRDRIQ